MRDYTIKIVAVRGVDEIDLKTITEQAGEDLLEFQIGQVADFSPLDRSTRIIVRIESTPTPVVGCPE